MKNVNIALILIMLLIFSVVFLILDEAQCCKIEQLEKQNQALSDSLQHCKK